MPRVVVKKLAPKKNASRKLTVKKAALKKSAAPGGSVTSKSVRNAEGRAFKVWAIDANSPTFGDDLSAVFARNVSKARRENTERFGSPDRVTRKAR